MDQVIASEEYLGGNLVHEIPGFQDQEDEIDACSSLLIERASCCATVLYLITEPPSSVIECCSSIFVVDRV